MIPETQLNSMVACGNNVVFFVKEMTVSSGGICLVPTSSQTSELCVGGILSLGPLVDLATSGLAVGSTTCARSRDCTLLGKTSDGKYYAVDADKVLVVW